MTTVFTNLLFTGHEQEAQDDSDEELEVSNLQLYLFILSFRTRETTYRKLKS